jgi:hypothetical protein
MKTNILLIAIKCFNISHFKLIIGFIINFSIMSIYLFCLQLLLEKPQYSVAQMYVLLKILLVLTYYLASSGNSVTGINIVKILIDHNCNARDMLWTRKAAATH